MSSSIWRREHPLENSTYAPEELLGTSAAFSSCSILQGDQASRAFVRWKSSYRVHREEVTGRLHLDLSTFTDSYQVPRFLLESMLECHHIKRNVFQPRAMIQPKSMITKQSAEGLSAAFQTHFPKEMSGSFIGHNDQRKGDFSRETGSTRDTSLVNLLLGLNYVKHITNEALEASTKESNNSFKPIYLIHLFRLRTQP
jgi:hypothetical protein